MASVNRRTVLLGLMCASSLLACSEASGDTPPGDPTDAIAALVDHYEYAREALVEDQAEAAVTAAAKVAKQAERAQTSASKKEKPLLADVAKQAKLLSTTSAKDMPAVRRAFGELSRALIVLAIARPSLRSQLHIFRCPMAEGYKKWVQRTKKLANPYMGQSMPRCGSSSQWKAS